MADESGMLTAGLVRALAVVCLVAGVFVMHGLTTGHHPAMSAMSSSRAGHVSHGDTGATLPLTVPPSLSDLDVDAADLDGMAGLCLAVLVSTLLLVIPAVVLVLRTVRQRRRVRARPGFAAPERSPPWPAPSLSKLCVLRT